MTNVDSFEGQEKFTAEILDAQTFRE